MRILHYFHRYYPAIGGTENDTRELSIELVKMGHRVSVFTTDALEFENYRSAKYISEVSFNDFGVKVFRFHTVNSKVHRRLSKVLSGVLDGTKRLGIAEHDLYLSLEALSLSPLAPRLFRTFANCRCFDVINGTMCGNGELLFLEKICLKNKTPFVFTPRSHLLNPFFRKTSALWLKIARNATVLIALTKPEKTYYTGEGIDSDKVFITGIGVLLQEFQATDPLSFRLRHKIPINNKIVLHIGRMDKYKGAGLTIEGIREVWKKEPETSLVIIGKSTAYTSQIEQIAKKDRRIVLLPDASENDKQEALSCSSLLIHPSLFESFGKVFLEAWAAQKPVVGARTPVNQYVIDEWKDGLLLDVLTPEELAKKITFLLENESIAKEMGRRGKEKVLRSYTWEKIAQRTYEAYKWAKEQ